MWHYGIILHISDKSNNWYGIHSIYYGKDNKLGWSKEPTKIVSEDIYDIQSELLMMLRDIRLQNVFVVNENGDLVEELSFDKAVRKYQKGTEDSELNKNDEHI